jgi:RHS repeat-associated protein
MLLSRNGQSYTNDPNGNTLSGGGRTMTWDSQNRMASCIAGTGANQKTSNFAYGTDGLRRRMQVVSSTGSYTTDYVLDGQNVVQELTTTSANVNPILTATYLQGPSGPMYKRPANSVDVRWYVYDGGGNVTGEVDPLGNLTSSKKHDVYGATRSSSGTAISKHGWQGGVGHQSDEETGLVYMRARYYAPELGRFQSEDPKGDGLNWFIYCKNSPVDRTDMNGAEDLPYRQTAAFAWGMILTLATLIVYGLSKIEGWKTAVAVKLMAIAAVGLLALSLAGTASDELDFRVGLSDIGVGLVFGVIEVASNCKAFANFPGAGVAMGYMVAHAMMVVAVLEADNFDVWRGDFPLNR